MPLDIEAARRLHDRGENNPAHCDTCTDPAGAHPVYWPCPTATALGATGRSEWDDTATHAPQNRCGSTGGDPQERCIHMTGHTSMHTNRLGDLW